jgi:putative ABC transport system substrate-binding protein
MKRREFITLLGGAAVAWPHVSFAQRSDKVRHIGILANEPWPPIYGLREGLRELGYIEKQNLDLVYRFAEGQSGRYAALAGDLVHLPVDVIVTWGTPASLAAKEATSVIPIIMTSGDPIAVGLVPADLPTQAATSRVSLRKPTIWRGSDLNLSRSCSPDFHGSSCFRTRQIRTVSWR